MEKTKLRSGLTLLFEKRKLPLVTIMIAVKVGSINETERFKGLSHVIEHTVFKGTTTRTQKQISEAIEKIGGSINAFTSDEITGFFVKVPSKDIEIGLDILSDITLNPVFPEQEIEKEKKVILEEIKMIHDNPQRYIFEKSKQSLYRPSFGLPIIGSFQTVSSFNKKLVENWHAEYYNPGNMILAVVGNAEMNDIINSITKKIRTGRKISRKPLPVYPHNKKLIETRQDINQVHLALSVHMPTLNSRYRYAAELLDAILGFGMSSRLFQEIREKRGLAYAVKSYLDQGINYSHLTIYAGTMKQNVDKVRELILQELKHIRELKQSELEQARNKLLESIL
jgi:predicted Zn-dependent peptidase